MHAKDVIKDIRAALNQTKSEGHSTVSIDAMENYLSLFDKDVDVDTYYKSLNHEKLLTEFKAHNDRNIAHANNVTTHNVEMFKSVISAGQSALKASMIINGGGAVALLAFTGKIWATATSALVANSLTTSIFIFCVGVLLSAFATGTTYLSQFAFSADKNKIGNTINSLSIISILGAYISFCYGAYTAATSLGLHFGL